VLPRDWITYVPGIAAACVTAVVWVLVVRLFFWKWFTTGTMVAGSVIASIVVSIVTERLIGTGLHSRQWDKFVAAYTKAGQCPSCGYGLRGLPITEDGCVVCPECTAAWRFSRLVPDDTAEPN